MAQNDRSAGRGRNWRGRQITLVCGVALSLGACVVSLLRPSFLAHLDNLFFDSEARQEESPGPCRLPLIVALDDEALARFGHWPWPRAVFAQLLDRLAALRPASVGIDVLFPEPEGAPANGRTLSAGELALTEALARGPFVLGCELTFGAATLAAEPTLVNAPVGVVSVRKPGAAEPRAGLWRSSGAVCNLPELERSVGLLGFLNAGLDSDGILRRVPLLIEHGDRFVPSLGLATVLRSLGARQVILESSVLGDCELRAGDRRIPLDLQGRLLLRYRCQNGCPTQVSAATVLDGRVPREEIEGRVVFVGATAAGLGESIATPVSPVLPGVAAHAITAGNILQRDFARRTSPLLVALLVLAFGLAGVAAAVGLPPLRGALLLSTAGVATWFGTSWMFHLSGLVISPVLPIATLGLTFILLTLVHSVLEEKQAKAQARDLAATRDFVTESLISLAAIRDTETGAHIARTQRYLHSLCEAAAKHPHFREALTPEIIGLISKLAPIHDIGKVGVPDELLHKATRLTAEEFEAIKKHAAYGRDAIANAEARVGVSSSTFLQIAKDLVYCHHEWWDGTGYPEGLAGERIPLAGRLMAIVDVYDALVSRRAYKEPIAHDEAVRSIVSGSATQFDPVLVDVFLTVANQWRQPDTDSESPIAPEG